MGFASFHLWLADLAAVCFAFAFGCCIGSLTNVLVYRLPRGLDVVLPTSACPNCGTHLTWRENIPVFGWLRLRGRCRFCWSRISPEYPLVEFAIGLLFALTYWIWYVVFPGTSLAGFHPASLRPDWAQAGFLQTWPMYVVTVLLMTLCIAMALVDLKTYTVPLVLAWIAAALGIIAHPAHALWIELTSGRLRVNEPGWPWTIPTPDATNWPLIGVALGGIVGLGVSNLLLATGLIRRSFDDYETWEREAREQQTQATPEAPPTDLWIRYPHARREMVKELAFLAPPVALAMFGHFFVSAWIGGGRTPDLLGLTNPAPIAPLWLLALSGSLLGVLIGGGVVWAVRILGSLAFGKEAVGMGDVHLMAAVGACLGWIDPTIAFFLAAFVGLAWEIGSRVVGVAGRRAMPFVPCLVIAVLLTFYGKPGIEAFFGALTGRGSLSLP